MIRLSPVRHLWQLRNFIPLTPLGLVVILASWWAYKQLATDELDFVIHSVALVSLWLVGLNALVICLAALDLWLSLRGVDLGADLDLESGVRTASGFTYRGYDRWPLVQVQLGWANPPEVEVQTQPAGGLRHELILARNRGSYTEVVRWFRVADIFGLSRLVLHKRIEQRLWIVPSRARVTAQVIQQIRGGDALCYPGGPPAGDPLDLRRYAHGDPLRMVVWKIFGRTRQLLVRTPEQAVTPSPSAAGYMVAGPDDEASASAARFFLEEGLLGSDFLFCADGAAAPTSNLDEALQQLVLSVFQRQRGGVGLDQFVRALADRRRALILFLPATAGPWLTHVERLASQLNGTNAIVAIDEQLGGYEDRPLRSFVFEMEETTKRFARKLPPLVRRIRRSGLEVRILHRPSGQLLAPAQLLGKSL